MPAAAAGIQGHNFPKGPRPSKPPFDSCLSSCSCSYPQSWLPDLSFLWGRKNSWAIGTDTPDGPVGGWHIERGVWRPWAGRKHRGSRAAELGKTRLLETQSLLLVCKKGCGKGRARRVVTSTWALEPGCQGSKLPSATWYLCSSGQVIAQCLTFALAII